MSDISIYLVMVLSFIFLYSLNPLTLSLSLVVLSVLSFPLVEKSSTWMAISLVLIFLGGMMVVFLSLVMLSNAEKVVVSLNSSSNYFVLLTLLCPLLLTFNFSDYGFPSEPLLSVSLFFNSKNWFQIQFLTFFLLFSLLTVMKLIECFKGAMGKK